MVGLRTRPRRYQYDAVEQIQNFDGRALLADDVGLGKAQPLTAKILTPAGWVLMGDLQVGDLVIGSDGTPTTVIQIFPQGRKKVFRVTFRDGSSTECCDDHLWSVWTLNDRSRGNELRVLPLSGIRKQLKWSNGACKFYIPMVKPVEFQDVHLPLHPYLMGYLLANGCITGSAVTVTIPDRETFFRLSVLLPKGMCLRRPSRNAIDYDLVKCSGIRSMPNQVIRILRKLKLMGCYSNEKFIPHAYLYSSVDSRVQLLQGLMDGDGWYCNHNIGFSSSSEVLTNQVQELVKSLGGTCKVHCKKNVWFVYKGERKRGLPAYIASVCMPEGIQPFQLHRKLSKCPKRRKYLPSRAMVKVEFVDVKECQCIRVTAKDGLYVTDNYIVTHNSLESLLYMWEEVLYPTVIVCPASIKWNWQNEIRKHFGMRSEVLCGTKPSLQHLYKPKIVIINYDILRPWMEFLRSLKPKLVLLDEAQNISNYKTIRSRQVKFLCRSKGNSRKVIALTGTPFRSRHSELWHILHVIRPDIFSHWTSFAWRYCSPRKTPWGWQYKGSVRHKELNRLLRRTVMIRRTKEQVLKELPSKTRIVMPMELSNRREYIEAQTNLRKWLIKHKKGKARFGSQEHLERLAKFHYLKQLAAQLKLPAVHNWIDGFLANNEGKLVVFAVHRAVLKALEARYAGQALRIDGSVVGRKRQRVIDAFQTDAKYRLCFCNISIASGFNLTEASTASIIEYPWEPGTVIQAEGRIHRLTQKSKCTIYYQFGRGTIEEDLIKLLQRRQQDSNATLDGDNRSDQMDIFDQLERLLLRRQ